MVRKLIPDGKEVMKTKGLWAKFVRFNQKRRIQK